WRSRERATRYSTATRATRDSFILIGTASAFVRPLPGHCRTKAEAVPPMKKKNVGENAPPGFAAHDRTHVPYPSHIIRFRKASGSKALRFLQYNGNLISGFQPRQASGFNHHISPFSGGRKATNLARLIP